MWEFFQTLGLGVCVVVAILSCFGVVMGLSWLLYNKPVIGVPVLLLTASYLIGYSLRGLL